MVLRFFDFSLTVGILRPVLPSRGACRRVLVSHRYRHPLVSTSELVRSPFGTWREQESNGSPSHVPGVDFWVLLSESLRRDHGLPRPRAGCLIWSKPDGCGVFLGPWWSMMVEAAEVVRRRTRIVSK